MPGTLADLFAGAIAPQPTQYDRLKGYERGMEPVPPPPHMPGMPQDWLRGMDSLLNFREQLLRPPVPPVDPDALAAPMPRRGLQVI